jgi:hypothetical protein
MSFTLRNAGDHPHMRAHPRLPYPTRMHPHAMNLHLSRKLSRPSPTPSCCPDENHSRDAPSRTQLDELLPPHRADPVQLKRSPTRQDTSRSRAHRRKRECIPRRERVEVGRTDRDLWRDGRVLHGRSCRGLYAQLSCTLPVCLPLSLRRSDVRVEAGAGRRHCRSLIACESCPASFCRESWQVRLHL